MKKIVRQVTQRIARERRERRDEKGAVLIMALIYTIAVSMTVGALATWATNDLNDTTIFTSVAQMQNAVSGITNTAIQSIRYNPDPAYPNPDPPSGASGYGPCWGTTTSSLTINNENLTVYCNTVENLANSVGTNGTRVVTLITCLSSKTLSACTASPLLTAVVSFDDYPNGGSVLLTKQCNALGQVCGEGSTLVSWIVGKSTS